MVKQVTVVDEVFIGSSIRSAEVFDVIVVITIIQTVNRIDETFCRANHKNRAKHDNNLLRRFHDERRT